MKVLHVLDHSLPLHSGYVFRTQGILAELRELGIETRQITSGKHESSSDSEMLDGYLFHRTRRDASRLDLIPGGDPARVILSLRRRLTQVVAAERPDLIHVHSPCLNGLAALPVARSAGIPLVYEMRASWEDAAVSHGTTKEGSIRYRLSRLLETHVLRRADAVITICDGLRRDVQSRGIDPAKITVTPNAVDSQLLAALDRVSADEYKVRSETRPVIGFFGSFYAYEGLLDLVESMPQILAKAGGVKLLLLGSGDQEAEVRNAIRCLRLEGQVELAGRVAHENVAAYYKAVDVFVFPRLKIRLTDVVTPLKPLEAMYAGALVIASDVGGHRELIQDGMTGVLFPAGDRSAMCAAIVAAVSRLEDYAAIRAEGRRFVASERTWPKVVASTAAVYESLLRR